MQSIEATTYYDDIIEQFKLGQRFLKNTFNIVPSIGWSIDPFGHSLGHAYLLSKMGFDASFIERINFSEMDIRFKNKDLEFIWNTDNSQLFTHINVNQYYQNAMDIETILQYKQYLKLFSEQSIAFKHKHLFYQCGDDFAITDQSKFQKIEAIMQEFKKHPEYGIKLQYSTPQLYVSSVLADKEIIKNFTIKNNSDFFPYADNMMSYWVGYYSSRPSFKQLIRNAGIYLRSVKQLIAILHLKIFEKTTEFRQDELKDFSIIEHLSALNESIHELEKVVAMCTHHDIITGTGYNLFTYNICLAKRYVINYYIGLLNQTQNKCKFELEQLLTKQISKFYFKNSNSNFISCEPTLNSTCIKNEHFQKNTKLFLVLFNPLNSHEKIQSLTTPSLNLTVSDIYGKEIQSQMICSQFETNCQLFYQYKFCGYGFTFVQITQNAVQQKMDQGIELTQEHFASGNFVFSVLNSTVSLRNDKQTIEWILQKDIMINHTFSLNYNYYFSSTSGDQYGGAYIMRICDSNSQKKILYQTVDSVKFYNSSFVTELIIKQQTTLTKYIFYHQEKYLGTIETQIQFLPSGTQSQFPQITGQEYTLDFTYLSLDQQPTQMLTDSNGITMIERNFSSAKTIQQSFYPLTSQCALISSLNNNSVDILVDHAQGVHQFNASTLEFLIQRIIYTDDNRGMEQELSQVTDQQEILFFKYYIVFSNGDTNQKNNQIQTLKAMQDLKMMNFLATGLELENLDTLSLLKHSFKEQFEKLEEEPYLKKIQFNIINETALGLQLHTYDQQFLENVNNESKTQNILKELYFQECSLKINSVEKFQITQRNLDSTIFQEIKTSINEKESYSKFIKIQSYILDLQEPINTLPYYQFNSFDQDFPTPNTIQANETQMNETQVNQTQVNKTQVNETQLNETQLNETQINETQVNETQVNETYVNETQVNETLINETSVNDTQVNKNETQLNETQVNETQINETQINETQFNEEDEYNKYINLLNSTDKPEQTISTIRPCSKKLFLGADHLTIISLFLWIFIIFIKELN